MMETNWALARKRPMLEQRARIIQSIRAFFIGRGYLEVETPHRIPGNAPEVHIDAAAAEGWFLHTSPELAMKRLLAAGYPRLFQICRVWRREERGGKHLPEFTMLEWYRANAPYEAVMADAAALLKLAAETVDNRFVSYRGVTCNPRSEPERLTVAEAFSRYAGIDLLASMSADGSDRDRLAAMADAAGIAARPDDTWSDIFAKVLTALVEPKLGNGRATLLTEYPAAESALARPCAHDARIAERFELYCCGVELANGFGELTDADAQRHRLEAEMDKKQARYGERYPLDEAFLAALAYMPPASGCALGFDRLVMLAAGATRIDQVIWTPLGGR